MCGTARLLTSRARIMLKTRVVSVWNASSCKSSMSFVYSSNASGMPSRAIGQRDVARALRLGAAGCAARSRARSPGIRRASCGRRGRGRRAGALASARTESRMLPSCACACQPLGRAAAVAEQALEHDARVDLGEIRRRLVAPRHGVHVEAVARVARALRRRCRRRARASARGVFAPSTSAASWSAVVASFTSTPGRVRS